jgi:4-amino-4-deoxy-L-arabinose transferase-like glycosyltransferase
MTTATSARPEGLIDEALAYLDRGVTEFRRYLATPEGRALRKRIAQAAIIGAPLLFRLKFVRNHPVGRVLGIVGGAALVVKLAEALRDWEPIEELAEDLGFAD